MPEVVFVGLRLHNFACDVCLLSWHSSKAKLNEYMYMNLLVRWVSNSVNSEISQKHYDFHRFVILNENI